MAGTNYALEDGLLVRGEAWAWFRLPTRRYELLTQDGIAGIVHLEEQRFLSLRGHECHLLAVPRRYPVDAWADRMKRRAPAGSSPALPAYLDRLRGHLADADQWRREVYLGVKIPQGRQEEWSLRGALGLVDRVMGTERPSLSDKDLSRLRTAQEAILTKVRTAHAGAELATAAELRWLIQRTVWRGIEDPPEPARRAARGHEVVALADGVVHNDYRWLGLEQPGYGTGYTTTLAVSRMPDELELPGGEWLYAFTEALAFPVEVSVRFKVVPPREARQDMDRRRRAAIDQAVHVRESGAEEELPTALVETAQAASELAHMVERAREPLVYAWARLQVSAPDPTLLREYVLDLTQFMQDMGIELTQPAGEQLGLFLEAMPGDHLRVTDWKQTMACVSLAGSMYCAGSKLGDGGGWYLGTSSVTGEPVFLDLLRAARTNRPTLVPIIGRPGAGKSSLAMKTAYEYRLWGVAVLMVDPKAEADGLASLPGIGQVNRIPLHEMGTAASGLLDPWRVYEDKQRAAVLATDLCRGFLPPHLAREVEAELGLAAEHVATSERPSLVQVVDHLEALGEQGGALRTAAATLRRVSRLPWAHTCFGRSEAPPLRLEDALTILQCRGLTLPEAGKSLEDYSEEERLGAGVVQAMNALAAELRDCAPTAVPKMLIFDEAYLLTQTDTGRRLVEHLARTGRSKNTLLLLVTQNAQDLLDQRVRNCIAAVFAFNSQDPEEIAAVLELLQLPDTPEHRQAVRNLGPSNEERSDDEPQLYAEAIFRGLEGEVGRLCVDLSFDELRDAFDTRPGAQEGAMAPVEAAE